MKRRAVTIDFDKTLTEFSVQHYCKKLIAEGIEVYILTYRYDDIHMHLYNGLYAESNQDLYDIADELGIPRQRIIFTNCQPKSSYLKDSQVLFHLDDDDRVVLDLMENSHVRVIKYLPEYSWLDQCNEILGLN